MTKLTDLLEPGSEGNSSVSQAISLKRLADHLVDLTLILSAGPAMSSLGAVPVKHSSSEMSTLAAKYIALDMEGLATELGLLSVGGKMPEAFAADIRSLAASVLSQDGVKGQK